VIDFNENQLYVGKSLFGKTFHLKFVKVYKDPKNSNVEYYHFIECSRYGRPKNDKEVYFTKMYLEKMNLITLETFGVNKREKLKLSRMIIIQKLESKINDDIEKLKKLKELTSL